MGNLFDGIDVSIPLSMVLAGVFYMLALSIFPEPRAVFGPLGPRWVRASNQKTSRILGSDEREGAVMH